MNWHSIRSVVVLAAQIVLECVVTLLIALLGGVVGYVLASNGVI